MSVISVDLQCVLKYAENLYRKAIFSENNCRQYNKTPILNLAARNNFRYYIAREILRSGNVREDEKQDIDKVIKEGKNGLNKVRRALLEVNELPGEYLIVKTYRGFPRIPGDIDVLTEDINASILKLEQAGYYVRDYDQKEKSALLEKAQCADIHLHHRVTWAWTYFMDNDFVWEKPRISNLAGVEIPIPNPDADFLMHIAHINYEPLHILLSELLYLFKLIPDVNIDRIKSEATRYRWDGVLLRTLNLFNDFHNIFFGCLCFSELPFRKVIKGEVEFPFFLSRGDLVKNVFEKRLFLYPLLKLGKVIKVLLSGDPYSGYYTPGELK